MRVESGQEPWERKGQTVPVSTGLSHTRVKACHLAAETSATWVCTGRVVDVGPVKQVLGAPSCAVPLASPEVGSCPLAHPLSGVCSRL